jgi:hypothetical protein
MCWCDPPSLEIIYTPNCTGFMFLVVIIVVVAAAVVVHRRGRRELGC